MNTYLVFVGFNGIAIPIGVYDEGWLSHFKMKQNNVGRYVAIHADSFAEALTKAKEGVVKEHDRARADA